MKLEKSNKYKGFKTKGLIALVTGALLLSSACTKVKAETIGTASTPISISTPYVTAMPTPTLTPTPTPSPTPTPTPEPLIGISELGLLDSKKDNIVNTNKVKVLEYSVENTPYISFVFKNKFMFNYEYENIFTNESLFSDYADETIYLEPIKDEYKDKRISNYRLIELKDYIDNLNTNMTYGELEEIYKEKVPQSKWVNTDLKLYMPLTDEEIENIERLNIKDYNEKLGPNSIFALIFMIDGEKKVVFVEISSISKEMSDVFTGKGIIMFSDNLPYPADEINATKRRNFIHPDMPMTLLTDDKKEVTSVGCISLQDIKLYLNLYLENIGESKYEDKFGFDAPINFDREWSPLEIAEFYHDMISEENRFYSMEYIDEYNESLKTGPQK